MWMCMWMCMCVYSVCVRDVATQSKAAYNNSKKHNNHTNLIRSCECLVLCWEYCTSSVCVCFFFHYYCCCCWCCAFIFIHILCSLSDSIMTLTIHIYDCAIKENRSIGVYHQHQYQDLVLPTAKSLGSFKNKRKLSQAHPHTVQYTIQFDSIYSYIEFETVRFLCRSLVYFFIIFLFFFFTVFILMLFISCPWSILCVVLCISNERERLQ